MARPHLHWHTSHEKTAEEEMEEKLRENIDKFNWTTLHNVSRLYEQDMVSPITSAVRGDLIRMILIQMQYVVQFSLFFSSSLLFFFSSLLFSSLQFSLSSSLLFSSLLPRFELSVCLQL